MKLSTSRNLFIIMSKFCKNGRKTGIFKETILCFNSHSSSHPEFMIISCFNLIYCANSRSTSLNLYSRKRSNYFISPFLDSPTTQHSPLFHSLKAPSPRTLFNIRCTFEHLVLNSWKTQLNLTQKISCALRILITHLPRVFVPE